RVARIGRRPHRGTRASCLGRDVAGWNPIHNAEEHGMKTFPLGAAGPKSPNVVAGMMRIDGKTDAEVRELYDTARGADIDFFDHANIYGRTLHGCEERFAEALRLSPAEREEITLQTKCGIVKDAGGVFDFSYEHIIEQVNG